VTGAMSPVTAQWAWVWASSAHPPSDGPRCTTSWSAGVSTVRSPSGAGRRVVHPTGVANSTGMRRSVFSWYSA
jgi:hypothetical protein